MTKFWAKLQLQNYATPIAFKYVCIYFINAKINGYTTDKEQTASKSVEDKVGV